MLGKVIARRIMWMNGYKPKMGEDLRIYAMIPCSVICKNPRTAIAAADRHRHVAQADPELNRGEAAVSSRERGFRFWLLVSWPWCPGMRRKVRQPKGRRKVRSTQGNQDSSYLSGAFILQEVLAW